jgi:hypothetical protein
VGIKDAGDAAENRAILPEEAVFDLDQVKVSALHQPSQDGTERVRSEAEHIIRLLAGQESEQIYGRGRVPFHRNNFIAQSRQLAASGRFRAVETDQGNPVPPGKVLDEGIDPDFPPLVEGPGEKRCKQ